MWTPLTPTVCIIQALGTDILNDPQDSTNTMFFLKANFVAACVDVDGHVVAIETDEDGMPLNINYTGSVPVVGDETKMSVRAKMEQEALAAFGDIDVPVVFI